eukprot:710815-Heterocapsa_arctica.AAC.1
MGIMMPIATSQPTASTAMWSSASAPWGFRLASKRPQSRSQSTKTKRSRKSVTRWKVLDQNSYGLAMAAGIMPHVMLLY